MKNLEETKTMMTSCDYKERFKAEYYQLENRTKGLETMLNKWENGELNFTPSCDRELLESQLDAMKEYLRILTVRAKVESIDL